jgi:zinc transport system substrate-binding protein
VEEATALITGGRNLDDWAEKFSGSHHLELLSLVPPHMLLSWESHGEEKGADSHHHHVSGIDPHFWTDPLTVKALLPNLVDHLSSLDPAGTEIYRHNRDLFHLELDTIHIETESLLRRFRGQKVMLSHPFFRYFLRRYGIDLLGIVEIAPGTEPTLKEMRSYIRLVKENAVKAIFTHPQLSDRPARLVGEATGIRVIELDPLGGVPGRRSYKELISYNAQRIAGALK